MEAWGLDKGLLMLYICRREQYNNKLKLKNE